ncbi:protein FAM47E isoform X2 [Brachyhypopomus gauderio]|uniref:protein FAM47E isoform X2 n=1 Tax=Brachyhypopomus gauderio TaxID=698409 RepID=UPI00404270B0
MTDRKLHIEHGGNPLHPWYKERLRTKFLKDPVKKSQLPGTGHGGRYGAFRDGTFTQPRRPTAPVIFGLSSRARPGRPARRITEERVSLCKHTRRGEVEVLEPRLTAHPLALCPRVESGMTPEMHVKREPTVSCSENPEERAEENVAPCESPTQEPSREKPTKAATITVARKEEVKGITSKNPYKLKDVSHAKEKQLAGVQDLGTPSQDEDLEKVTKLFCDWVTSLGGETNNLTESTIMSLFVSGYEKKPASTFPIHVLEPSQIPKEPHTTGECLRKDRSCCVQPRDSNKVRSPRVKTTYGAWYLDPKTWKKRPANEPLRDPSATRDLELMEQPTEKDEELKQIHGTRAFKQFIVSKGLRMPRFLNSLLEEDQDGGTRGRDGTSSALTRKGTVTL